jgi:hypothetical protein
MPGPVSDSYDPEFGTGYNCSLVREAVTQVRDIVSSAIGTEQLKYILDVIGDKNGRKKKVSFSERELRIIRFAMNRALESI